MRYLRFELGDGIDRTIEERLFASIYVEEGPRRTWISDVASVRGIITVTVAPERPSEMAFNLLRRSHHPRIS